MTDSLNQLGKTLKDGRDAANASLKRLHKKKLKIERVVDLFDAETSFTMDFSVERGLKSVYLDLYFKPPVDTTCCAGNYCSSCEIFNAGEEVITLSGPYIPGSVTVQINGRIETRFTETSDTRGVVTINVDVPVGAMVRICSVTSNQ